MLYLVHGEDEFRRSEWLAEMRRKVALDEGMADLNTVVLNGQRLTPEELEANCSTVPFLADKRLVIVEGLAQRAEPRHGQEREESAEATPRRQRNGPEKRLAEYLAQVPPTTDLILAETRKLGASNLFLTAVKALGGRVVELYPPRPDSRELRDWVIQRARYHGAQLTADALDQLVAYAGNNLRLIDQELAKLAAYGDGKPLTADDIYALVSYAREVNVFDLVDALGRRDTRKALRKLHDLLAEGEAAQYLVFMIVRQVRLLMLAREALDRGLSPYNMAEALGAHPFVAQKVGEQARNFSLAGLRGLHDQLVETDWAIKNGRLDAEAGLDLFISGMGKRIQP